MAAEKQEIIQGFEALKTLLDKNLRSVFKDHSAEDAKTQREIENYVTHLLSEIDKLQHQLGDANWNKEQFNTSLEAFLARLFPESHNAMPDIMALAGELSEKIGQQVDALLEQEEQLVQEEEIHAAAPPTSKIDIDTTRLTEFKAIMSKQLEALETEALNVQERLRKMKETGVTLLSKEEREAIYEASLQFKKQIIEARETLDKLTDIGLAKGLVNNLLTASNEFHVQCTTHQHVFERSDAFTVFNPTRKAAKDAFKMIHGVKHAFIEWETKQTPERKAEREAKTISRRENLHLIQNPVEEADGLILAISNLNDQLKESRTAAGKFPLETRWEPYRLVEKVQDHLDELTKAYANNQLIDGYTHATAIGELIAKAHTKEDKAFLDALTVKADAFFHKVDTYSEALNTEFSTQIKHEERLRAAIQQTIEDTDRLIRKLNKMDAPSDLITPAEFFRAAAKEWQTERLRATPQQRKESNKKMIWAHKRFNIVVNNTEAQKYINRYGALKSLINAITESANYFREMCGFESYALPFRKQRKAIHNIEERMQTLEKEEKGDSEARAKNPEITQKTQALRTFIDAEMEQLKQSIADARLTQTSNLTGSKTTKDEARTKEIKARNELHQLVLINYNLKWLEETNTEHPNQFREAASLLAHRYYEETTHGKNLEAHMLPLIEAIDEQAIALGEPTHIQEGRAFEAMIQGIIDQTEKKIEKLGGQWYLLDASKERDANLLIKLRALNIQARAFLNRNKEAKAVGGPWIPREDSPAFTSFERLKTQALFLRDTPNISKSFFNALGVFLKKADSKLTKGQEATIAFDDVEEGISLDQEPPYAPALTAARESTSAPINTEQLEAFQKTSDRKQLDAFKVRVTADLRTINGKALFIQKQMTAMAETSFTWIPAHEREQLAADSKVFQEKISHQLTQINSLQNINEAKPFLKNLNKAIETFREEYNAHKAIFERSDAFTRTSPTQKAMESTFHTVDALNDFEIEWETQETDYTKAQRKENDRLLLDNLQLISDKSRPPEKQEKIEDFSIATKELNAELRKQREAVQTISFASRSKQFQLIQGIQRALDQCIQIYANNENHPDTSNEQSICSKASRIAVLLNQAREESHNEEVKKFVESLAEHANNFFDNIDELTANTVMPTNIRQDAYLNNTARNLLDDTDRLIERLEYMQTDESDMRKIIAFRTAIENWQTTHAERTLSTEKEEVNQALIEAYDEFNSFVQNKHVQEIIHSNRASESCLNGMRIFMNCFRRLIGLEPYQLTERHATMQSIKEGVQDLRQAETRGDLRLKMPSAKPEPEITSEIRIFRQFIDSEMKQLKGIIKNAEHTAGNAEHTVVGLTTTSTKARTEARNERENAATTLAYLEVIEGAFKGLENTSKTEGQAFLEAGTLLAGHYYYSVSAPNSPDKALEAHITPLFQAIDEHAKTLEKPTDIQAGKKLEETVQKMTEQAIKAKGKFAQQINEKFAQGDYKSRASRMLNLVGTLIPKAKNFQTAQAYIKARADASWMPEEQCKLVDSYPEELDEFGELVEAIDALKEADPSEKVLNKILGTFLEQIGNTALNEARTDFPTDIKKRTKQFEEEEGDEEEGEGDSLNV